MFLTKIPSLSKTWNAIPRSSISISTISPISTSAALSPSIPPNAVQDFRTHFWNAVALRKVARSDSSNWNDSSDSSYSSNLSNSNGALPVYLGNPRAKHSPELPQFPKCSGHTRLLKIKAMALERHAREEAFAHFRVSAASRAMQRGDGFLSEYFSLRDTLPMSHSARELNTHISIARDEERRMESDAAYDIVMVAKVAKKAREEMFAHFWRAHRARKTRNEAALRNQVRPSDTQTATSPTASTASKATVTPKPSSKAAHSKHHHRLSLPSTLNDAYLEFGTRLDYRHAQHAHHQHSSHFHHSPRPMALTETRPPFKIVDVNKAWVDLCGYTREQAIGSTLKSLLHGPETNEEVARSLTRSLASGADGGETSLSGVSEDSGVGDGDTEHEAVLINYRSDGMRFRNHVRVGQLRNEMGEITHFVGVFKRLSDENDGLYYANV